jgi:hypothetical protein
MNIKLGKKRQLPISNDFKVTYGTVNALDLKSIFIKVDSWAEPRETLKFDSLVKKIRNDIIRDLNKNLDENFVNKNFIVDFDLRHSGMSTGKKSFMSIDLTFYLKVNLKFSDKLIEDFVVKTSNDVIDVVSNNNFLFSIKKK